MLQAIMLARSYQLTAMPLLSGLLTSEASDCELIGFSKQCPLFGGRYRCCDKQTMEVLPYTVQDQVADVTSL
jgi:hypothetical protein